MSNEREVGGKEWRTLVQDQTRELGFRSHDVWSFDKCHIPRNSFDVEDRVEHFSEFFRIIFCNPYFPSAMPLFFQALKELFDGLLIGFGGREGDAQKSEWAPNERTIRPSLIWLNRRMGWKRGGIWEMCENLRGANLARSLTKSQSRWVTPFFRMLEIDYRKCAHCAHLINLL